jgi:hypothetical protein
MDEYAKEVLAHLANARKAMKRLGSLSQDWVAKELVEIEFQYLADQIRDFARFQLGIVLPPECLQEGR